MQRNILKTSVVVTTYNGEKYIVEQLESIKHQTMKADEVIIRDDFSTDTTFEIVKQYIRNNQLLSWRVIQNKQNVGWKVNFKKALEMARGDIIFLCDQDDVWLDNKIEEMASVMMDNSKVELLASDFDLFINGNIIRKKNKKEKISYRKFNKKFFHTTRPGAVYAIRKNLLEELLPIWNEELPHDAQLWCLATVRGSLYTYNCPLILYRRHENTATGRDKFGVEPKMKNVEYEKGLIDLAYEYNSEKHIFTDQQKAICNKAEIYTECRKALLSARGVLAIIKMFPYLAFYIKTRVFFGDVIATIKITSKKPC